MVISDTISYFHIYTRLFMSPVCVWGGGILLSLEHGNSVFQFHFAKLLMAVYLLQVIIFVKSVQRCMALAQLLVEQNFPAIAIHRAMTQEER